MTEEVKLPGCVFTVVDGAVQTVAIYSNFQAAAKHIEDEPSLQIQTRYLWHTYQKIRFP